MVTDLWLTADDSRWRELLASFDHDVYATPEYGRVAAAAVGGRAVAWVLLSEGGEQAVALIPLISHEVEDGLFDVRSPYGYGGIAAARGEPIDDVFRHFADAAQEKNGLLSSYIQLHPILNDQKGLGDLAATATVHSSSTYGMRLRSDVEPVQDCSSTARYEVRRAFREGASFEGPADEDAWRTFAKMYEDLMVEKDAREGLRFGPEYFADLYEAATHELFELKHDDRTAAAALVSRAGGIWQYHLGADDGRNRKWSATRALLVSIMERAKAKSGDGSVVHLGGGVGGSDDGLARFKQSLTNETFTFTSVGLAHAAGIGACSCGFFPGYRCRDHAEQ